MKKNKWSSISRKKKMNDKSYKRLIFRIQQELLKLKNNNTWYDIRLKTQSAFVNKHNWTAFLRNFYSYKTKHYSTARVRNCKGRFFLTCELTSKLVCRTLVDGDRRHKAPERETKALITYGNASRCCVSILLIPFLEPSSHKHACPFALRVIPFLFPKAVPTS